MSSNRHFTSRRFVILGALGLAGCGFKPVYGTGGVGNALLGKTRFSAPETVFGYRTRTALEDRFGAADNPDFDVEITLTETASTAAVNVEGSTTRFDIQGNAGWALNSASGASIANGSVQTFTSYSATGSTVATQSAEQDARARLAHALADLITADLIIAIAGRQ